VSRKFWQNKFAHEFVGAGSIGIRVNREGGEVWKVGTNLRVATFPSVPSYTTICPNFRQINRNHMACEKIFFWATSAANVSGSLRFVLPLAAGSKLGWYLWQNTNFPKWL